MDGLILLCRLQHSLKNAYAECQDLSFTRTDAKDLHWPNIHLKKIISQFQDILINTDYRMNVFFFFFFWPSQFTSSVCMWVSHLCFIIYTEDLDNNIRWSLTFFMVLYPLVCSNSSFQCFSWVMWHHGVTFTQSAVAVDLRTAKRWLLGCSATTQVVHFCTCFQDNRHVKGCFWILTVCPWPALS